MSTSSSWLPFGNTAHPSISVCVNAGVIAESYPVGSPGSACPGTQMLPLSSAGSAASARSTLLVDTLIGVMPRISRLSSAMISTPFAVFSTRIRIGTRGHRRSAVAVMPRIASFVALNPIRSWRIASRYRSAPTWPHRPPHTKSESPKSLNDVSHDCTSCLNRGSLWRSSSSSHLGG